ncbi:SH3 domain-binding protein 5 homolog isoform X2 [Macrosteles quadrilineatus]|uniref:SH3 domain-binding protein 5 homolog isoform X2 n=1 Tax=Macrosteles quadrilineatus TaxID=74068 RepID=UPI0023E1DAF9|nr:SH3 domain-binding protein 5 homolog isoform X2 [Macrosteles quadrilineatus]
MACIRTATDENSDDELDPRIQIELERLNNATDEINKLEMELDEAQGTFRILMNDSKRRMTLYHHKLGSCVDKARPYYEAQEICRRAQTECQQAARKFQRASEIHAAAKETVALAEARYFSKQDEWQFDTAWQEMLNHATKKVMEAEHNKSESGREHQKRATLYQAAEQKVQMLEQKLKRNIVKSRPYFDEKALCESSLNAQKQRITELQTAIAKTKAAYSASLHQLEAISEDIHRRRKEKSLPRGPREPGVGAELVPPPPDEVPLNRPAVTESPAHCTSPSLKELDCVLELDDTISLGSVSRATSSVVSDCEDNEEVTSASTSRSRRVASPLQGAVTDEFRRQNGSLGERTE